MDWFKNLANKPISDLWLPVFLGALILLALLGVHWVWLNWRVQRLHKKLNLPPVSERSPDSLAQATLPMKPQSMADISDIHALTAQKNPVALEEQMHLESAYVPSAQLQAERLDPTFDAGDIAEHRSVDAPMFIDPPHADLRVQAIEDSIEAFTEPKIESRSEPNTEPDFESSNELVPQAHQETRLIEPQAHALPTAETLSTVLLAKPPVPVVPSVHPVFHYPVRFTWADALGKEALSEAIAANPWTHGLPVIWTLKTAPDTETLDDGSMIAALQVASRRELANEADLQQFKSWCESFASATAGRWEAVCLAPWESFIDEAHGLLIGLDSVIVLKVSVPMAQLDLFTQSLLAARFTQAQEHWYYQEKDSETKTWLERLWHQSSPDGTANQQAVFQVMIDIPHLDSFEGRRIYMRLRAVARTSAAILQSAQGVHLAEGMLDRYSRELMMKQESLSKADVAPGSVLAKQLFHPQLSLSSDLTAA